MAVRRSRSAQTSISSFGTFEPSLIWPSMAAAPSGEMTE